MENVERRRYKEKFSFNYRANKAYIDLSGKEDLPMLRHIVIAHHIWLQRLISRKPNFELTDELTLDQIKTLDAENLASTLSAVSHLPVTKEIQYTNLKGMTYKNSFAEIMDHVLMHAQYHRGQISMHMKLRGVAVPGTDLIAYYRSHSL